MEVHRCCQCGAVAVSSITVCACAESWIGHPNSHAAGDTQFCPLTHQSGGATRKAKFLVIRGTSQRARRWLGIQGKDSVLIIPDLHYSKSCKHPVLPVLLHPCVVLSHKKLI